jgi:hypothetical protein
MSESTMACDEAERGINYQSWLANRIAIQFLQTGTYNPTLCREYADKYGVAAEKQLIASIAAQAE